ncbi:MAG: hypothetical protein A4E53_03147 [Pelotomaculum sp. PtaB.Bin104]|nr:MAG: hypothetical protein A4E53_03147 [Pelotomaculum sp. PtaB.Bin104]
MSSNLILGLIVLLLVLLSVKERIFLCRYREKNWEAIGESKSSPFSQALVNLIGVAGGIYLSLVLLCTFLELDLPMRVNLGRYSLEPLATISIILAIAQPYFQKVVMAWRRI